MALSPFISTVEEHYPNIKAITKPFSLAAKSSSLILALFGLLVTRTAFGKAIAWFSERF